MKSQGKALTSTQGAWGGGETLRCSNKTPDNQGFQYNIRLMWAHACVKVTYRWTECHKRLTGHATTLRNKQRVTKEYQ